MQQRVIIKDRFLGSSFQRGKKNKPPHKTCSSLREGFKSSPYVRRPGYSWFKYFQGPQGTSPRAAGTRASLRAPAPPPPELRIPPQLWTLPSADPLPPSGSTARRCEGPGCPASAAQKRFPCGISVPELRDSQKIPGGQGRNVRRKLGYGDA